MNLRQSLSHVLLAYSFIMTGWWISISLAVDTAPASSNRQPASEQSATTQPAQTKRVGVVQAALKHLYSIPRPGSRQFARKTKSGSGKTLPKINRNKTQLGIVPGVPPPVTSNRLGLQHRDAIRNSVSSLPIGDDINGAQADKPYDPQNAKQGAEPASTNVYIGGPPHYRSGRRLSEHERSYADYRYYGGRPSRYGRGRYREYSDYDGFGYGCSDGDMFRFGFMEGYDTGYFDRTTNERVESVLAHAGAQLNRGIELFREGRYLEAADAFQVASDMDQGSAAARIYAGHALFAIGRYRDAMQYIRRAFELQPKIAHLTYDMRGDYGDRAAFDEQFEALQAAIGLSPLDPARLFMAGYVLYYSGQRSQSYPYWIRANKLDKSDALVARLMRNAQPSDVELDRIKSNSQR